MAKPKKTFIGINYSWRYFFFVTTKKEGGVKLFRSLKKDGHRASNPEALAKYCGQLFYSPKYQVLWYRISLWKKGYSRALYAVEVPAEVWKGIDEADPEEQPRAQSSYTIRSKNKLELTLKQFRARKNAPLG